MLQSRLRSPHAKLDGEYWGYKYQHLLSLSPPPLPTPPYRPSPATQCTATQEPGSSLNLVLSSFSQSSTISVGGGPPSSKGQSCVVGKASVKRSEFKGQSKGSNCQNCNRPTYQNLDPLLLHRGLVIGGVADSHQRVNVELLQLLTNQ